MKKYLVCFSALIIVASINGCKMEEISSNWDESLVAVNGDNSEWQSTPILSFKKPEIAIGVRNDNDFLYILIGFKEQSLIRLFLLNGVTLWIDPKGGKNKDLGLKFVSDLGLQGMMQGRGNTGGRGGFRGQQLMRGLSIVKKNGTAYYPALGENTPLAALKTEFEAYTLEFKIPMKKSDDLPYDSDILAGGVVSLGFEALPPVAVGRRGGPTGGENTLGRAGARGGRHRGGRGGGGANVGAGLGGNQSGLEKQELWMKITLASKNQ